MRAIFDSSEATAHNIRTFWFKPDRRVHFLAGQYTELYLPHPQADDRGERRWFTLSSSPTDELLSITTKFSEPGSTFKQALSNLTPGTAVSLAEPMGDFVLPKDASIPLVFVAGGMGITPMHSMVKYLHETKQQRTIQLIYTVAHDNQLLFADLFRSYQLDFIPIVGEPSPDWQGQTGRLDAGRVLDLVGDATGKLVYLSGPEPLIEALTNKLEAVGLRKDQVVTDFFPGYTTF